MPGVLTKLRVDEILSVDKAAGEGCKIVLYKRDDSDERGGFYHRLFRDVGKRGVVRHSRRLRGSSRLRDIADAKHALLHSPDGRVLLRDTNASVDELASHLLEASSAVTTKRNNEVTNMDLIDVCKSMNAGDCTPPTEHELTEQIQKYASKYRRSGETAVGAFNRILTSDDEIGLTFRKSLAVCKRANGFPV